MWPVTSAAVRPKVDARQQVILMPQRPQYHMATRQNACPLPARAGIAPGDVARTGERNDSKSCFPRISTVRERCATKRWLGQWSNRLIGQRRFAAARTIPNQSLGNQLRQSLKQKHQSAGAPQPAPMSVDEIPPATALETVPDDIKFRRSSFPLGLAAGPPLYGARGHCRCKRTGGRGVRHVFSPACSDPSILK